MSVQRRQNWVSEMRVDVPMMRSVESAVSADFDTLFQSWVTGTTQGYVVRGFNILMTNAIGNAASSLQMKVDPGALMHIAASQSGTMYLVPSGMANQVLNSATNTNVTGSFTPNSINYVTVDYVRYLDFTTNIQAYFWDPSSKTEYTKIVPSAQIMKFVLNISTATPAPNQLPLAIVQTNSSNLVVSITDARWLFCSLGTGGLSPNPFYNYPWTQGRTPTQSTSTSDSVDPFSGGDKSIGSLKELLNAMLTTFKEIKGTPYWSSQSSTATFPYIYQNAALNALSGGTWVSPTLGHLQLHGGATLTRFGFANSLTFAPFGPSLGADSMANTATVTDNIVVSYTTASASTTNIGDTVTIGVTTRIVTAVVQTSPTLTVEVAEPGFTNGVGLTATLTHYGSFNLTTDQVLYTLFPVGDTAIVYTYGQDGANPIVPQQVQAFGVSTTTIQVPAGGNYITNPLPGPNSGFILVHGQLYNYNTYTESLGVGTFNNVSPNPVGLVTTGDYVYQIDNNNTGYYHLSTPSAVPGTDSGISLGVERVYWLAFYDGSSNIILREGSLSAGEAINVGDTLSTAILSYMGMPTSGTNFPTYTSNIRGVTNENLTARAGNLTNDLGDEQEDRSAYFSTASPVAWSGTTVTFPSNIILNIYNSKSGTATTHTILSTTYSPLALADGQMFYVSINRTSASETLVGTVASSLPAQTQTTKDIFVVFQRRGTTLVAPFNKQIWQANESKFIGDDSVYGSGWTTSQFLTYVAGSPGYLNMLDGTNTTAFLNLKAAGLWLGGSSGVANSSSIRFAVAGDPIAFSSGDTVISATTTNNISFGIGSTQVGNWNNIGLELLNHLSLNVAPTNYVGIYNNANLSGSTTQYGVLSVPNFSSGATVNAFNFDSTPATAAAVFTCPAVVHYFANTISKGAGSTITRAINYLGATPTEGVNNAFLTDSLSFTGNWFINQSSTTPSLFSGAITANSSLTVNGILALNNNLNVTGSIGVTNTLTIGSIVGGGGAILSKVGPNLSLSSGIGLSFNNDILVTDKITGPFNYLDISTAIRVNSTAFLSGDSNGYLYNSVSGGPDLFIIPTAAGRYNGFRPLFILLKAQADSHSTLVSQVAGTNVCTFTTISDGSATVNFPFAFDIAPVVTVLPVGGGTNYAVSSVTTTSFRFDAGGFPNVVFMFIIAGGA